ncbi:MAG: DUF11 domain-containing protein [Planctomycetaceae bacterium]|jgi:uncharacterized repeat protein (TIGR01451 family)|nr:DUF11 domain-containing protein [Planctomycetaceae bacterium]
MKIFTLGVGIAIFVFTLGSMLPYQLSAQVSGQSTRTNPLRTAAGNTPTTSTKNANQRNTSTVPASGTILVSGTTQKNNPTDNHITHATTTTSDAAFSQPINHNLNHTPHEYDPQPTIDQLPTPNIAAAPPTSLNNASPFDTGTNPFQNIDNTTPLPINNQNLPIDIPTINQFDDNLPTTTTTKTAANNRTTQPINTTPQEGTGTPGPPGLEGEQTPHLTIEKVLPAEIIIDQPATIKTVVKNIGRSSAKNVTIKDRIPQGTKLLSTTPKASTTPDGELIWNLGNLDGSEQLIVEMRVVPTREGEIGSVAIINYQAEASSRTLVTRPKIHVDVKAPQEIKLGEVANIEIIISNPGTATATGIIIEEHIPDGLYHKDGKVLVNKNIEMLKPKEVKKIDLPLTCIGAGTLQNRLVVKANGNLREEVKTTLRALAPVLDLKIVGAKQRFLERKSDFKLVVSNTGTASAQGVELKLALPISMQFISTNQSGVYEPTTHTVHWALEELPALEAGEIDLVLMPAKIGNYTMRFVGNGKNNLKADASHQIIIDGMSALSFEVTGDSNLVEIGKDAVYEIKVANKGTKSAGNVRVNARLSNGMSFVNADGPVRHQSQNGIVQFEPLAQLDAKGEKIYKIAARCDADGDHRITVQIVSDDLEKPITKEESTRVFK